MAQQSVELAGLFQAVTRALIENQTNLNTTDAYNHDHGTNMVQTFKTITNALEQKKSGTDGAALAYAARMLNKSATSGSGKLYAENLAQAANQFKGKNVNEQDALQLLQTLIGSAPAGQAAPTQAGGVDMLGTLLGSLAGGETQTAPSQSTGGDMLGALLGSLTGEEQPEGKSQPGGLNLANLLSAGMAFMQTRQSGGSNLQAIIQAVAAGSGMGTTDHRTQSTQLVIQSFLQALSSMGARG